MQHFFPLWLLLLCVLTCLREENSALLPIIHSAWHGRSLKSGTGMSINSVVFPQKPLISQGQVSLRWFIKTRHLSPPLLSGSAFRHHSDRWTECVIKGAAKTLERSEDKKAEGPWRLLCGATASQFSGRGARTNWHPGQGARSWCPRPSVTCPSLPGFPVLLGNW